MDGAESSQARGGEVLVLVLEEGVLERDSSAGSMAVMVVERTAKGLGSWSASEAISTPFLSSPFLPFQPHHFGFVGLVGQGRRKESMETLCAAEKKGKGMGIFGGRIRTCSP